MAEQQQLALGPLTPPSFPAELIALPPLVGLPHEILLHIAGTLDQRSLARWLATSQFFYHLFVDYLYQRDVLSNGDYYETSCSFTAPYAFPACTSFRWGCHTGNLRTLRRAVDAGADPNWDGAFATALAGEDPIGTVTFLLEKGASPNASEGTASPGTFWPILHEVLSAASLAPRWCPVPVVACFLAHGARLRREPRPHRDPADGGPSGPAYDDNVVMFEWQAVMALPQVRGPRRKRLSGSPTSQRVCAESCGATSGDFDLRYDHCQHTDEPCHLALTRLLLHNGADPNVSVPWRDGLSPEYATSLVSLAMCDPRKPIQLLRCLADAGANLSQVRSSLGDDPSWAETLNSLLVPAPGSRRSPSHIFPPPPLHMALEDAIRLDSLTRYPRGRNWDCYPDAVRCHKAADVVRFLLTQGVVPLDIGKDQSDDSARTKMLLDRWDRGWRRFLARRRKSNARKKNKFAGFLKPAQ